MQDNQSVSPLALAGALTGILALIFSIIYLFFRSSKTSEEPTNEPETKPTNDGKKPASKATASKSTKPDTKSKFVHPWLCASLKAHSSSITSLAFSHNDKFLASAAEGNIVLLSCERSSTTITLADDSVLLWQTKDFDGKDHKCVHDCELSNCALLSSRLDILE